MTAQVNDIKICPGCGIGKSLSEYYDRHRVCKVCTSNAHKKDALSLHIPVESLKDEEWRSVSGYHGYYEVSNKGRVKSLKRIVIKEGIETVRREKLLAMGDCHGYSRVSLSVSANGRNYFIHRLVAIAFIENKNNHTLINHIDGNKKNNNVSNLEWCTQSENAKHSFRIGLQSNKGNKHPGRILSMGNVIEIRRLLSIGGITQREIGEQFGVKHFTISKIKTKKHWNY